MGFHKCLSLTQSNSPLSFQKLSVLLKTGYNHNQYDTARRAGKTNLPLLVLVGIRLTPEFVPVTLLSIPSNVSSSVFIVSSSSFCCSIIPTPNLVVVVVGLFAPLIPYVKLWVRINFEFLPKFLISLAHVALCLSSCIAT